MSEPDHADGRRQCGGDYNYLYVPSPLLTHLRMDYASHKLAFSFQKTTPPLPFSPPYMVFLPPLSCLPSERCFFFLFFFLLLCVFLVAVWLSYASGRWDESSSSNCSQIQTDRQVSPLERLSSTFYNRTKGYFCPGDVGVCFLETNNTSMELYCVMLQVQPGLCV